MKKILFILLSFISTAVFSQVTNSGFDSNLSGWTTISGAATQTGPTTIGAGGNAWNILPAGTGMARIQPNGNPSNASTVQSTLGLTSNQLTSVPSITNVAAIYQDITLSAGDTITAYWNYVSQDYAPYDDGTFASLTGPSTQVFTLLARTESNAIVPAVKSYGSSGWHMVKLVASGSGTFRLGFGSYNWGDNSVDPILFVDNARGGTAAPGMPVVSTTDTATNITSSSATTGGNVTSAGGTSIIERGVVYSTSPTPTLSNTKVTTSGTTGTFTISLTGLSTGTTYYVRAFARNSGGTTYGPEISFTTSSSASAKIEGTISIPNGLSSKPSLSLYKVVNNVETFIETKTVNNDGTYSFSVTDLNTTYKLAPTLTIQGITSDDFTPTFNEVLNLNTPTNTISGTYLNSGKKWKAADVSKNGILDLGDAFLIAAHLTGLVPIGQVLWFSASDYDSLTQSNYGSINSVNSFTLSLGTTDIIQNIKYCILGDVNLSHSSN